MTEFYVFLGIAAFACVECGIGMLLIKISDIREKKKADEHKRRKE